MQQVHVQTDDRRTGRRAGPSSRTDTSPPGGRVAQATRSDVWTVGWVEWAAVGAVVVAFCALGLIRMACNDITWHLATARLVQQTGHWPTVNTFSHTYPDYPLFQQYPLFQMLVYKTFCVGGWRALTVLNCAGWLAVLLVFVRWAGSWRLGAVLHLPWMIGVMALQRRMILRPDMLSALGLGLLLVCMDRYRVTGRWWWCAPIPAIHLLWANAHQLFPLGLAVQVLLIVHVIVARRGWGQLDRCDATLSIALLAAALVLSVVACLATPLGTRIIEVAAHTGGSLAYHRNDVQEFARVWSQPVELRLAILCLFFGLWACWRLRRRLPVFEVGLWLATLVMTLAAVRGLMFFGLVSIALFGRSLGDRHALPRSARDRAGRTTASPRRAVAPMLRWAMASLTLVFAARAVLYRWVEPPLALGGTQPGLGRSIGDWPDRAIAFLKASPPPGRMMNMPWSLADALIWSLPEVPVFVDPRLESYPRDFLVDCMASYKSDAVLDRLIGDYDITWIIASHRNTDVRERTARLVESGTWLPVYADTGWWILVKKTPDTRAYIRGHPVVLADLDPPDLVPRPAVLRARQRICFADLLGRMGLTERAAAQIEIARVELPDGAWAALRDERR